MNGTSPPDRNPVDTEREEADDGRGEQEKRENLQHQGQEASSLRARRAELAERLEAARTALASARERREFMEEEAEQVWGCALDDTLDAYYLCDMGGTFVFLAKTIFMTDY